MDTYDCDRECCWYFERLCYAWSGEPILSPQKISLAFQANLISITAGHFSTGVSCDGETVKAAHPITGKGMVYPEYCQILSYSITPEIDQSLFSIRDCAEGDKPRVGDAQGQPGGADGPTAVFMTKKHCS